MGKQWKQWQRLFSWAPKSLWMVTAIMKLKDDSSMEGKLWQNWQHIKKQRHHFADKGPSSPSYGFSNSHVWIWELDHKEGWALNNCFWIVELEKTLEISLGSKETKPVNLKGSQPWIFIGSKTEQDSMVLVPPAPGSMFSVCLFFHGKLQKKWKNTFNQGNEKCRNKEKQSKGIK